MGNNNYLPICSRCMDFYEIEYTRILGSSDEGLKRIASHWDYYVGDGIINASRKLNKNQTRIRSLVSKNNMQQWLGKTYDTYLQECDTNTLSPKGIPIDATEEKKTIWTDGDAKNMNYVVQTVGFDCFNDISYTEDDRKFLYNTLADYLTDDVVEDQHKLQSTISMVKTILQKEKIDKLLNAQIRLSPINYSLIEQLGKIKANLTSDINRTANENAISAKTSGKSSKGSNTLTNITKEMIENNFDDSKVNIVDVKMSNAYKTIAEQSIRALINELGYQTDDYARLLSEKSIFMDDLQDKLMLLEEENRQLKIQFQQLEGGDS